MTLNLYCDLKAFKASGALNITGTGSDNDLLRALEASSRGIDRYMGRWFYLWEGTRYLDGAGIRKILDLDVYSITSLAVCSTGNGVYDLAFDASLTPPDYFTYGGQSGNERPITRIEANPWGRYGHLGSGIRKAIQLVGVFGFGDDWPADAYRDSGQVLAAGGITASATSHTLASGGGSTFSAGMTVRLDTEQVYISAVATDTLTLTRGVNGTSAASHVAGTVLYLYHYPNLITQSTIIMAARAWKRKDTGFSEVIGAPEVGEIRIRKGIDPDVDEAIRLYQRSRYPNVW